MVRERAGRLVTEARQGSGGALEAVAFGAQTGVDKARAGSEALMREISRQGPEKSLRRGFAMVRDSAGQTMTRAASAGNKPGEVATVQFADGVIRIKIEGESNE
jgi:exodeoxyribonuclease VII large subunit